MNLLFILDYYLPMASANGVCVEKLVNSFAASGDQVSVLAFGQAGNSDLQENAQIYFCCQEQQDKKTESWITPFVYYLKWVLPSQYPVYARKAVTDQIVQAADEIIQRNHIDTVVCVHLPIESLLAGIQLKKKYPNVTFVAYALDSLSGGFLPRHLPDSFCRKRRVTWENRIYSFFNSVVLMQSSKAHHEKYSATEAWYRRSAYLDIPLFIPKAIGGPANQGKSSITFVGTMAEQVRTPYHFLKVLNKVGTDVQVVFAGNNSCGDLNRYCQSPHIALQQFGLIPYSDAIELVKSSTVLLNLGNKNASLVPSKIFEYMSTGKPIISTYSMDNDSSLPYLQKYPNVLLLDERCQDLDLQAKMLENFILNCGVEAINAQDLYKCYEENTPEAFVKLMRSLEKQGTRAW